MTLQLPWLAGEAVSRITPCLMRFATANVPWTAADVIAALTDQGLRRGHRLLDLDPHQIHTRPAVVLAGLLRDLDVDADHPRLVELDADQRRNAQQAAAEAIPPHECDHGWVQVVDDYGHQAVARCIGGAACARAPHHDEDRDHGFSEVMPAAIAAELDARLRDRRRNPDPTRLNVDQARARLRALPDWGRSLIADAPPGVTGEAAVIWAATEHLRRLS